jgi:hypothetical protein
MFQLDNAEDFISQVKTTDPLLASVLESFVMLSITCQAITAVGSTEFYRRMLLPGGPSHERLIELVCEYSSCSCGGTPMVRVLDVPSVLLH